MAKVLKNETLIRLEAAVIIFGWHKLSGGDVEQCASTVHKIMTSDRSDETKQYELMALLGSEVRGKSHLPGNERRYSEYRFNRRQFYQDMESIRELLK